MNLSLFLRLGRVSNLPTILSNVIAGALLSGADFSGNSIFLLALSFCAFYVGGMFLNDAFDADTDRVQRPERPIPRGEVERSTVYAMGGALLVLGVMLVIGHGILVENAVRTEPVLYALALAVCIVWYNADHENNWFSPALMGLNRVYVYATTAFALTPAPASVLWYGCGAMMSYLVGLTYLAKQENGLQWRSLWPLVLVALPVGYPALAALLTDAAPDVVLTVGLGVGLLGWIARAVRLARPKSGVSQLRQGVVGLIAGIALLDGLGAALMAEPMWAVACVALFVICLMTQRSVAGT